MFQEDINVFTKKNANIECRHRSKFVYMFVEVG